MTTEAGVHPTPLSYALRFLPREPSAPEETRKTERGEPTPSGVRKRGIAARRRRRAHRRTGSEAARSGWGVRPTPRFMSAGMVVKSSIGREAIQHNG